MMRTVSLISSGSLILLILGSITDNATAHNYFGNIRKILSLMKDYERGYDYYRKSSFWNGFEDPRESAELSPIQHEVDYIYAQAYYATNFSDLHSIFVVQTLAMIYALKLRAKPYDPSRPLLSRNSYTPISIYKFLAQFGADSESVGPAILAILWEKNPESYDEFEKISKVFVDFQCKVKREISGASLTDDEEKKNKFKKTLNEDMEKLIEYIKITVLQNTNGWSTGLGIEGGSDLLDWDLNIRSLELILEDKPNRLHPNFDDDTKVNMFRSTAMRLMIQLLNKISTAIIEGLDISTDPLDAKIDSFVHVRRGKATKTLIFTKIPYTYIENAFPESRKTEPEEERSNTFYGSLRNLRFRRPKDAEKPVDGRQKTEDLTMFGGLWEDGREEN